MDSPTPATSDAPFPATGHESIEIRPRGLFVAAAILAIFCLAIGLSLTLVMRYYARRERAAEESRPSRFVDTTGQFPNPRLQGSPTADLARMRAQDERAMRRYGWDAQRGVAVLPIDRAMDILVRKGLPTQDQPSESPGKP